MTTHAPYIKWMRHLFPPVEQEIAAFRETFCGSRTEPAYPTSPDIHVYLHKAKGQHLVCPLAKLPCYPEDPPDIEDGVNVMVEQVLFLVSPAHERLHVTAVNPHAKQRLMEAFLCVDPQEVAYACSVRRRRITLMSQTLCIVNIVELSVGVLREPLNGFAALINETRRSAPLFARP